MALNAMGQKDFSHFTLILKETKSGGQVFSQISWSLGKTSFQLIRRLFSVLHFNVEIVLLKVVRSYDT